MGGQGLFTWMIMEQAGRKRLAIINGKNEIKYTKIIFMYCLNSIETVVVDSAKDSLFKSISVGNLFKNFRTSVDFFFLFKISVMYDLLRRFKSPPFKKILTRLASHKSFLICKNDFI